MSGEKSRLEYFPLKSWLVSQQKLRSHTTLLCAFIIFRWNRFVDGFVATGQDLQTKGFSEEVAKLHLSQGSASCLVVPLIMASLDPLTAGQRASGSTKLRDTIELDCRGRLQHLHDDRYLLEFSEIKSSLEGMLVPSRSISEAIRNMDMSQCLHPCHLLHRCEGGQNPSSAVCSAHPPCIELGPGCQGPECLCHEGADLHPSRKAGDI